MKVAITGHSTGIGKSLYEILKLSDYEVVGFSRSNGWDFCQTATRTKFFNTIVADKFDCFVNNAYPYSKVKTFEGFLQVELLNNVWLLWQNQNKQIILYLHNTSYSFLVIRLKKRCAWCLCLKT